MSIRYFELIEGTSRKFLEIRTSSQYGSRMTIRHGKIGTKGQDTSEEFDDSEVMKKKAKELIAEKTHKGYVEKSMIDCALGLLPTADESIALFAEARRLTRNLQQYIEGTYPKKGDGYEFNNLGGALEDALRGCLKWELLIDEIPFTEVDRRKSMLKGPFFITDKYPIPCVNGGEFMIPIIQADLRELSSLSRLPLGDGLLQVWWAGTTDECRVIPRKVVDKQEPLPFPMEIKAFATDWNFYLEDWMLANIGGSARADNERLVKVLMGYHNPHIQLDVRLEENMWEDLVAERTERMEAECSEDEELEATVIEFKNRLDKDELQRTQPPKYYKRLIEILTKLERSSGEHAFGPFHGIHFRPRELDDEVLFAFEDELPIGGAGNAHVMFGFKGGKPYFHLLTQSCR